MFFYVFWLFVLLLTCSLATARSPFASGSGGILGFSGSREILSCSLLANLRPHAKFWKKLSFWCISRPGTYLERCAVKFWPSLPPRLLILKTKTFPLCKNNENLEFRSQCHILRFGRSRWTYFLHRGKKNKGSITLWSLSPWSLFILLRARPFWASLTSSETPHPGISQQGWSSVRCLMGLAA